MGKTAPEVSLYAISIPPLSEMEIELSPEVKKAIPRAAQLVWDEARWAAMN
jgi:Ni,Fe-hydrogenase maturation factor